MTTFRWITIVGNVEARDYSDAFERNKYSETFGGKEIVRGWARLNIVTHLGDWTGLVGWTRLRVLHI